jgi:hypothetical protein
LRERKPWQAYSTFVLNLADLFDLRPIDASSAEARQPVSHRHVPDVAARADPFGISAFAISGELGIMSSAIRPQGATETEGKWRRK